ncbi:hypothetical protein PWT90_10513 [Aphanocladium album]|nr:hypothetical protein PWT90_10513 [Aphanocladium album]
MAATCSLPLHSTLQPWDTGDTRTSTCGNSIVLASYSSGNTNSGNTNSGNTNSGSSSSGPSFNRSRGMGKVSALGHGALDHSHQAQPSSDLSKPAPFGMIAQHGEPNPILKRSYSTPAVRSMAQESATSAGEKKRNKLGYHRTSIACSHCRRRKIRCIVSPEIQNRCINCVRLKKDCSFYPVDQQALVDSRGKPTGQGTSGSTAHSQSSSPALAPGHPVDMASRSMYGAGSMQDSMGHVPTPIVPSNVGYGSVTGEGMPIPAEQNFSVSPGSSLAWGSAEPSPVTLPGSMDMSYGWRPYGSESGASEQMSPFGPGPNAASTWMTTAATPAAAQQPSDWNWSNGGMPPTTQARSMSFSGELMGQSHPPPFVPVPSNVPSNVPYNRSGPELRNMFASPMNQAPSGEHAPSLMGGPGGGWQPQQHQQQQQMLQQQQPRQQNVDFESWAISHGNGPSM